MRQMEAQRDRAFRKRERHSHGRYPLDERVSAVDSGVGGGSVQGVIDAVERVMSIADRETQFIPGHGPLPPRGTSFLEEYVAMLSAIQNRVKELIDDGLSEDALVAAQPTEVFDARWGNGFMTPALFTRVVYSSLASGN